MKTRFSLWKLCSSITNCSNSKAPLFCQKAHTKLFKKRSHWLKSAQNVWFSENNWQHYLVYKSVICDGMFINKYGQNISKTAEIACWFVFQWTTNLVTILSLLSTGGAQTMLATTTKVETSVGILMQISKFRIYRKS